MQIQRSRATTSGDGGMHQWASTSGDATVEMQLGHHQQLLDLHNAHCTKSMAFVLLLLSQNIKWSQTKDCELSSQMAKLVDTYYNVFDSLHVW